MISTFALHWLGLLSRPMPLSHSVHEPDETFGQVHDSECGPVPTLSLSSRDGLPQLEDYGPQIAPLQVSLPPVTTLDLPPSLLASTQTQRRRFRSRG